MAGTGKPAEHHPIIGPVDPNEREAQRERHVASPLLNQQRQQVNAGVRIGGMWDADRHHQHGKRKREDPSLNAHTRAKGRAASSRAMCSRAHRAAVSGSASPLDWEKIRTGAETFGVFDHQIPLRGCIAEREGVSSRHERSAIDGLSAIRVGITWHCRCEAVERRTP
jgi:hypothetical protein